MRKAKNDTNAFCAISHCTSNTADTVIQTDAFKLSDLHGMNVSTINKVLQQF